MGETEGPCCWRTGDLDGAEGPDRGRERGHPRPEGSMTVSGVAAAAGDPEEGRVGKQLLEAGRELMATPRPGLFRDGAAGDRSLHL